MEAEDKAGWVGKTLDGRYEILRALGEGAMGTVYVGRRLVDQKQFAIKFLRPDLASQEQFAIRFKREAAAQKQLRHQNIVGAFESGDLPSGGAYMVMQLVRGRDLKETLEEEGAMSWRRACTIGVQVADALAAAHKSGIIHRDLKLANIMIEKSVRGRARALVLDFGLASLYQNDQSGSMERLTVAGFIVGSPGYVAPEQLSGNDYDHTVDLYALGVILWECIAGRRLWKAENPMETLLRQLREKPEPLPTKGDSVAPEPLRKLIYRLISSEPSRRPQSAEDVRNELGEILLEAQMSSMTMRRAAVIGDEDDSERTAFYRPVEESKPPAPRRRRARTSPSISESSLSAGRRPKSEDEKTGRSLTTSRSSMSSSTILSVYQAPPQRSMVPYYALIAVVGAALIVMVLLGVL